MKQVNIKVIDDGKGIAAEHIGKLFENYFQFYDSENKNTGYGIGLSLSKGIIEMHHGTLKVESARNTDNGKNRPPLLLVNFCNQNGPEGLASLSRIAHKS